MPASPPYREGHEVSVRVLRVMDGDSLELWDEHAHARVEVRLDGIDAPEIGQRHSQRARRHLERLARGRLVLRVTGIDRYGRVLGVLRNERGDRSSLNRAMVEAGWAYHYEQYAPRARVLREAQALARRERRGVWAGGDEPMRPWDYRRFKLQQAGKWREPLRRRRRTRWGRRRWRRRRRRCGYGLVLRLVLALIVLLAVMQALQAASGP